MDKNAPKAPQCETSTSNMLGLNCAESFVQNEVIPFGPYLKDTDDLSSRDYEKTQGLSLQSFRRVLLTLITILVIIPLAMLIVIIRLLRH